MTHLFCKQNDASFATTPENKCLSSRRDSRQKETMTTAVRAGYQERHCTNLVPSCSEEMGLGKGDTRWNGSKKFLCFFVVVVVKQYPPFNVSASTIN